MQLEFHQLDRRWEHLRVREPHRQRRLLASLADSGQQTPIVVVAAGPPDRYLVIDGHKRVAALEQLGRDTVEATVWAMSEAEALLLERSLRFSSQESVLEQGWLLAEMEQRFGYSLEELARRFDHSVSWVSRHPAASTRGQNLSARGDEVSGANGPRGCGALRAHGRRIRPAALRHAASRATLYGLAQSHTRGARAHSGRTGTVFENEAAAIRSPARGGRTSGARSGDGDGHPAPCRQEAL
jgi:ParB/Sulfiredoxin domain